jgi:predicted SAM-dependent methyltransferase
VKLNLGGGYQKIPGYQTIDRLFGQEAYPVCCPEESVEEIRASHLLEHFGHREVPEVLANWVSKLKPGGVLKVAVPNFDWIRQHADSDLPIEGYLMGGQTDSEDFHKSIYTESKLRRLMQDAGLTDIETWESEIKDCASLPVSLNLQGRKPLEGEQTRRVHVSASVAALLSVPRLGWQDHFGCVWAGMRSPDFNIPIWKYSGAFWEQGIQRGLTGLIERGVEWAITLDYDTLFTPDDVKELLTLAAEYPEADAIVPVQARRGSDAMLFSMADAGGGLKREIPIEDLETDLTPLKTGHFGMTFIRLASLAKMPKPWFWSQPDSNGDWGDERLDADIYFWKKFKDSGLRAFQANHIKIGHIQVVASWPTNDWEIKHQYLRDWDQNGKPEEAR